MKTIIAAKFRMLASVVALACCIGTAAPCLAESVKQIAKQVERKGEILSPTPCFLAPAKADQVCAQVIVPLRSTFKLHRVGRGDAKVVTVVSDRDGHFTVKAPNGRYSIKLISVRNGISNAPVDASVLHAVPRYLKVSNRRGSLSLVVLHNDYTKVTILPIESIQ